MTYAVEDGTTRCPRCTDPLVFELGAKPGGGLRYEVSCPSCGQVVFEMTTPTAVIPAAA